MTHWTNGKATIRQADARSLPLESNSVHCIVTSPPYLGLRSYDVDETPWSPGIQACRHQWAETRVPGNIRPQQYCTVSGCNAWLGVYGSEPSIEEYLDHTIEIFRELKRVLRPDGTLWLNIGDSYNTDQIRVRSHSKTQASGRGNSRDHPKRKDLMLMPARVALALQQDGWYVRSEIIWEKLNSKPEAAADRPRRTHEQVYLLSKRSRYFYDREAVKTPASPWTNAKRRDGRYEPSKGTDQNDRRTGTWVFTHQPDTVNLRTVWAMGIDNRQDQHYAGFPERLAETCILAGTSEKGACPECGAQWTRTAIPDDRSQEQQPTLTPTGTTRKRNDCCRPGPHSAATAHRPCRPPCWTPSAAPAPRWPQQSSWDGPPLEPTPAHTTSGWLWNASGISRYPCCDRPVMTLHTRSRKWKCGLRTSPPQPSTGAPGTTGRRPCWTAP